MSTWETINAIEDSLPSCILKDQRIVCEKIISSKRVVFLDTCFMSSLKFYEEQTLKESLSALFEGHDKDKVVFVISELVIYEARDPRNNKIQVYVSDIISILNEMKFAVVVLKEESFCELASEYFARGMEWWNNIFITRLRENKPYLTKLFGVIRSDNDCILSEKLELSAAKMKDPKMIEQVISQLKERKSDKDSLAEELICIVIFFILECFMDAPKKMVLFCSVDNQALARIRMSVSNSYSKEACFENLHLFSLTQYMVKAGVLSDKRKVKTILSKTMPNTIKVIEKKDLPFCENEEILSLTEIVEGMFAGRVYQYKGN
ncbi:MAG: hypothetical protein E7301_07830 [Butyrivibrio sp.]|nr:hypothetical protein [Butyrivibrio sp.]